MTKYREALEKLKELDKHNLYEKEFKIIEEAVHIAEEKKERH